MCEPRAEPNLFELCRGEAINRIISNLCASREQSQTCLSYAEAMPSIGYVPIYVQAESRAKLV